VALVNAHSARIILSSIVVAELYSGVKGDAEQDALENFVSLFRVVPVGAEIAKAGGLYKRDYGTSHGVGLADAILAATAEAENAELKTLNTKHYPMLKDLRPAYKK
jgi:predicted nucleic acid-binding protein